MEQAKIVIVSSEYQSFIKEIQKKTKIKILEEYRETAEMRDNQKMDFANLLANQAIEIIKEDYSRLYRFTLLKLKKYENIKTEEEYPVDEEVEEEENNETILGYSQGFILLYLIEFYLLTSNPNKLLPYLKTIRVPNASKYEKELKSLYDKI